MKQAGPRRVCARLGAGLLACCGDVFPR